jgi:hypothetical protein
MNIFKIFLAIRSLGILFSKFGELLKGLSEIRSTPNLGDELSQRSDQEDLSQDSLNPFEGVKDEEPESIETVREPSQSDLFETTAERRSPSHT